MRENQANLGSTFSGQLWFCLQGSLAIFIAGKLLAKPRRNQAQQHANGQNPPEDSSLSSYLSKSALARYLVLFALFAHLALIFYMMDTNLLIKEHMEKSNTASEKPSFSIKEYPHYVLAGCLLLYAGPQLYHGSIQKALIVFIIIVVVAMVRSHEGSQPTPLHEDMSVIRSDSIPQVNYDAYSTPTIEHTPPVYPDLSQTEVTKSTTSQKSEKPKPQSSNGSKKHKQKKETKDTRSQPDTSNQQTKPSETIGKGVKEVPKVVPKPEEKESDWSWLEILIEILKFILEILL